MIVKSSNRMWRVPAILTLALVLAACGGGSDEAATDPGGDGGPPASTNEVTIENFTFMPGELQVPAGTTVTWTNQDENAHTVKDEGAGLFEESEVLEQGDTFTFTYETAGSYPYICGIHPYMKATVIVS